MTRREAARLIGATAGGLLLPVDALRGQAKAESLAMLTRAIPSTGQKLPAIGLGTWQAFDVDLTGDNRRQLGDVLSLFVKLGGRVIDTSPMYGHDALQKDGSIYIATDDADYFGIIKEVAESNSDFAIGEGDADLPQSKFGCIFRAKGASIHWLELRKISPVK